MKLRFDIRIREYVPDGCRPPRGYRTAWADFECGKRVAYPIGIHWLARLIRWVWRVTYLGNRPDALEQRDIKIMTAIEDRVRAREKAAFDTFRRIDREYTHWLGEPHSEKRTHTLKALREVMAAIRVDRFGPISRDRIECEHFERGVRIAQLEGELAELKKQPAST